MIILLEISAEAFAALTKAHWAGLHARMPRVFDSVKTSSAWLGVCHVLQDVTDDDTRWLVAHGFKVRHTRITGLASESKVYNFRVTRLTDVPAQAALTAGKKVSHEDMAESVKEAQKEYHESKYEPITREQLHTLQKKWRRKALSSDNQRSAESVALNDCADELFLLLFPNLE